MEAESFMAKYYEFDSDLGNVDEGYPPVSSKRIMTKWPP
jgi:hypothetical protein